MKVDAGVKRMGESESRGEGLLETEAVFWR